MQGTVWSGEGRGWAAKSRVPSMFHYFWIFHVNILKELAVSDVKLIGSHAHDRACERAQLSELGRVKRNDGKASNTIFIMQLIDFARVPSSAYDLVVSLIPA
jgi:hypothetical protein